MTGAVLIAVYLVTLALFLGLDVVRKVPPTLYRSLAAAIGSAAALLALVAFAGAGMADSIAGTLAWLATALGVAGMVAGLLRARLTLVRPRKQDGAVGAREGQVS